MFGIGSENVQSPVTSQKCVYIGAKEILVEGEWQKVSYRNRSHNRQVFRMKKCLIKKWKKDSFLQPISIQRTLKDVWKALIVQNRDKSLCVGHKLTNNQYNPANSPKRKQRRFELAGLVLNFKYPVDSNKIKFRNTVDYKISYF